MRRALISIILTWLLLVALTAARDQQRASRPDGEAIYKDTCAACHDNAEPDPKAPVRAPDRETLKQKSPESVFAAFINGAMVLQGKDLSDAEKRAVAVYISGKPFGSEPSLLTSVGLCGTRPAPLGDVASQPMWNGWGADLGNSRYQHAKAAGLTAAQVPQLKLKWAFGFPGATRAYAQPTVVGGRVFVGSDRGAVYALDAATGCTYWSFQAAAAVRAAVNVGRRAGARSQYAVYVGDQKANVYALDATDGTLIWQTKVDSHQSAVVTGGLVLHEDRVYVPVSSLEEVTGANAKYECCTFRGNVVALDAETGTIVWKGYVIPEEPKPTRKNAAGTQLYHPAGGAVWGAPTIDVKRQAIYVGTGNAYTAPAAATTDAVVALDLETGKIRWVQQATPQDAFVIGCKAGSENCPETVGPDYDFGNSPVLRPLGGGRDIIVIGQKSGVAYGMDPDQQGKVVWQFRAGKGSALGGIEWGIAADEQHAYVPVSDVLTPPQEAGGLFALKLATGEKVWHTPAPKRECTSGRGCTGAQSAAVTVIPGIVFSGSVDGHLRAYSTADGTIVWDVNTVQDYQTVNGVKAKGGSLDAAGPVVVSGMLFTNSGYGLWRGLAGNVLLAFSTETTPRTDTR